MEKDLLHYEANKIFLILYTSSVFYTLNCFAHLVVKVYLLLYIEYCLLLVCPICNIGHKLCIKRYWLICELAMSCCK